MSKGWRARLRRKRCLPFRSARSCKVAPERRDDRQPSLFAAVPTFCGEGQRLSMLGCSSLGDGCAGRVACEIMQRWEAAAVKAALLELERAASDEPIGLRKA